MYSLASIPDGPWRLFVIIAARFSLEPLIVSKIEGWIDKSQFVSLRTTYL